MTFRYFSLFFIDFSDFPWFFVTFRDFPWLSVIMLLNPVVAPSMLAHWPWRRSWRGERGKGGRERCKFLFYGCGAEYLFKKINPQLILRIVWFKLPQKEFFVEKLPVQCGYIYAGAHSSTCGSYGQIFCVVVLKLLPCRACHMKGQT